MLANYCTALADETKKKLCEKKKQQSITISPHKLCNTISYVKGSLFFVQFFLLATILHSRWRWKFRWRRIGLYWPGRSGKNADAAAKVASESPRNRKEDNCTLHTHTHTRTHTCGSCCCDDLKWFASPLESQPIAQPVPTIPFPYPYPYRYDRIWRFSPTSCS